MLFLISIAESVVRQKKNTEASRPAPKAQSAMEYLMTYSWAILIIIIVLAVLFQLGIFSSNLFTPRAQPGTCQVRRLNGPATTQLTELIGVCNGELPEYVMTARNSNEFVEVQNSYSVNSLLDIQNPTNSLTLTAWVNILGCSTLSSSGTQLNTCHDVVDKEGQYGMKIDYNGQPNPCVGGNSQSGFCLEWDTTTDWIGEGQVIPNAAFGQWMFLAVSMQGNTKYWYANGNLIRSYVISPPGLYPSTSLPPANFVIGTISPYTRAGYGGAEWFNGMISNVQVYNSTLSSNDILALYDEGVGGAPISLPSLVGWWPLNGDTKDYSGNNNTEVPSNIIYISTWTNGYTPV
jgi:hypothetical protein